MKQKIIPSMRGYKATDKNMQCRGYQFEIGKEFAHDGEFPMCASDFFCTKETHVISFDTRTQLTYEKFKEAYPEYFNLCRALLKNEEIEFEQYKNIPGITQQKLKKLHDKFKKARNIEK